MPRFIEMDERTPLAAQMETNVQPVILINTFTVGPGEAEQLVTAWAADAAWMQQQPGFISAQLHRGVADSGVFINDAVWQSTSISGAPLWTRRSGRSSGSIRQAPRFRPICSGRWRCPVSAPTEHPVEGLVDLRRVALRRGRELT
jgi:hypothetical protein